MTKDNKNDDLTKQLQQRDVMKKTQNNFNPFEFSNMNLLTEGDNSGTKAKNIILFSIAVLAFALFFGTGVYLAFFTPNNELESIGGWAFILTSSVVVIFTAYDNIKAKFSTED
jgi:hypothetical protein